MSASKVIAVTTTLDLATPDYWPQARTHLMKKDRVMKRLIPQFGETSLQTRGDAFVTLARSIVGQQISVKAARMATSVFPKPTSPHTRRSIG